MQVSVVIRTKNEAPFIGETLEAVYAQSGVSGFEVIVIDSGSTDGTLAIVKRFPVRLIEIAPESFSYGRALNIGLQAAKGDCVVSLSAHALPASTAWLASLLRPFQHPLVAGVYGRQLPRTHATLLELAGMRLSGVLAQAPRLQRMSPLFSNVNAAFRRDLCQVHPFDERVGGGEDLAWARTVQRRGYIIAYEPRAIVYHSHGEPLHRHLRRALRDLPTVMTALITAFASPVGRLQARRRARSTAP